MLLFLCVVFEEILGDFPTNPPQLPSLSLIFDKLINSSIPWQPYSWYLTDPRPAKLTNSPRSEQPTTKFQMDAHLSFHWLKVGVFPKRVFRNLKDNPFLERRFNNDSLLIMEIYTHTPCKITEEHGGYKLGRFEYLYLKP